MKEFYKNLSEIKFKKYSMLALTGADLITFSIFHKRITSSEMLNFMVKVLSQDKRLSGNVSNLEILRELTPLIKSFSFMLFAFVFLYHLALYILYIRGSHKCLIYIRFYAATATIGTALFTMSLLTNFNILTLPVLAATLAYSFFSFAPKELQEIAKDD